LTLGAPLIIVRSGARSKIPRNKGPTLSLY
jgi:hypothetical protein